MQEQRGAELLMLASEVTAAAACSTAKGPPIYMPELQMGSLQPQAACQGSGAVVRQELCQLACVLRPAWLAEVS